MFKNGYSPNTLPFYHIDPENIHSKPKYKIPKHGNKMDTIKSQNMGTRWILLNPKTWEQDGYSCYAIPVNGDNIDIHDILKLNLYKSQFRIAKQ